MSAGFVATATKFRYKGQRHTNDIKAKITRLHATSLGKMVAFLTSEETFQGAGLHQNFTGETQATFRQIRDYVNENGDFLVTLEDFTVDIAFQRQFRFPKSWRIPDKISNLANAGNATAAGIQNLFRVEIVGKPFKIKVNFETGAEIFQEGGLLFTAWQQGKEIYKDDFAEQLKLNLFEFTDFGKEVLRYSNPVTIRSH